MDKFDKEFEKLKDLEFDLNLARLSGQEEEIIRKIKSQYTKQYNKVRKLQEINFNEKKDKNSVNILED